MLFPCCNIQYTLSLPIKNMKISWCFIFVLCGLATISEEVDESNTFLKDVFSNYSEKEDNIQEQVNAASHRAHYSESSSISSASLTNYDDAPPTGREESWSLYCDLQIGCFNLTSVWYNAIRRPVNEEPWSRDQIRTMFSLYTREKPNEVTYLYGNDTTTITNSTFKASRPTKILIHGFLDTGYGIIFQNITTNLLINGDYNVIVTHWGPGSGSNILDYFQAVANARVVGLEVAFLINALKEIGVSAKDVHLIGHSLGAHISGYAGERIQNLGRISGLDPAGSFFTDMDPTVRLDPSDADFVDVLHTGAGYFGRNVGPGTMQPMGHVDIYANGGQVQPGCNNYKSRIPPLFPIFDLLFDAESIKCSHKRAREIFRDSLVSICQAVAYECTDYDSFLQGNCYSCGDDNSHCIPVGILAERYPNKTRTGVQFYYTTSNVSPFCQYQYAIQTMVAKQSSLDSSTVSGMLSIAVNGAVNTSNISLADKTITFNQGQENKFLITSPLDFGKVASLTLNWNYSSEESLPCDLVSGCNAYYVTNVTISSLNHYPEEERLTNTFTACPDVNSTQTVFQSTYSAIFHVGIGDCN